MINHKKYDVIFLGQLRSSSKWLDIKLKTKSIIFNDVLGKITDYHMNFGSTHAIAFGYSGAARMLDNVEAHAGIDLDLYRAINQGKIEAFYSNHINISQASAESEIASMGRLPI